MGLCCRVPLLAPFYGLLLVVRRSLRNRQRCQPAAQRFPVQRPLPQRPAPRPVSRPYGFVPAQRGRLTVEGGPFGSDRIGTCELGCPLFEAWRVSSVELASCPLFRDRTGRRTRSHVACHPVFWG